MQLQTNATLFSADTFHSNKTNKDYHRVGLIVEGQACTMFVNDADWPSFVAQPFFNAVCAAHKPIEVIAVLEFRFTDKGVNVTLRGVQEPPKEKGK